MINCDVILLASGQSLRMGKDKMLEELAGSAVIIKALSPFLCMKFIDQIIIVANENNIEKIKSLCENIKTKNILIILGGSSRSSSVAKGLDYVESQYVLIHDGARPFLSCELIERVYLCAKRYNSAIPVLDMNDSVRIVVKKTIVEAVDRIIFKQAQTPQGFFTDDIRSAYEQAGIKVFQDDSEIYLKYITAPKTVEGEESNIKITTPYDLQNINAKVGIGYDVHRLENSLSLTLCGVKIPHYKGLVAHSDGDVAVHALMDALLSACGERDIGYHFPDDDNKYKGISSLELLKKVKAMLDNKNKNINNLSLLITAEKPKLSPYVEDMKDNLVSVLNIDKENLSIIFTTTEGLGIVGEEKGIAAFCLCSLV